jgi:2-keto-4-pentenoate hydratase/2-oxohepta-3-ene-1,7-dioic acid hydratase in catechol pathway
MQWCRVLHAGEPRYGIVQGGEVALVRGSPFEAYEPMGVSCRLAEVKLLVPVEPRNFYAVGVNYAAHVEWARNRHKMQIGVPKQADIGYRSPNALIATTEAIVIPSDSPGPVEYEGELVAVVGKKARYLREDEALGCILGYTLGNDVTERSWQLSDRTLWRAKNSDTFKPMGPVIATGLNPSRQRLVVRVNGVVVNEYDTDKMIFSVEHYIARMSRYVTLFPGDVIWLGTDGACEPPLKPGAIVAIENEHIGVLRNPVVAETAATGR